MVHEQKFKDLLSSTRQVSLERRVLDLESKGCLGSILTGKDENASTDWERLIRSHSSAKVLLRIKWKFELTVHFKHGMSGK